VHRSSLASLLQIQRDEGGLSGPAAHGEHPHKSANTGLQHAVQRHLLGLHSGRPGLRTPPQHLDQAARPQAHREAGLPADPPRQAAALPRLQGEDLVERDRALLQPPSLALLAWGWRGAATRPGTSSWDSWGCRGDSRRPPRNPWSCRGCR
jgi:hypothetical protein